MVGSYLFTSELVYGSLIDIVAYLHSNFIVCIII